MRKLLIISVAVLAGHFSNAQMFNRVLPSNGFSSSVAKVVENYPNNYVTIQGESLPADEDREIFRSIIMPPGANQCVIYRFHSREDSTASWQCILYEGEVFSDATKAYKTAFKQLKLVNFKMGDTNNSFIGEMAEPNESLRFTTSTLRPEIKNQSYKNFIAEIEMINSFTGWRVQLNLYSRKDDKERYQ